MSLNIYVNDNGDHVDEYGQLVDARGNPCPLPECYMCHKDCDACELLHDR
jgi:hypothetical protein